VEEAGLEISRYSVETMRKQGRTAFTSHRSIEQTTQVFRAQLAHPIEFLVAIPAFTPNRIALAQEVYQEVGLLLLRSHTPFLSYPFLQLACYRPL
jgi:hypothetical protein